MGLSRAATPPIVTALEAKYVNNAIVTGLRTSLT